MTCVIFKSIVDCDVYFGLCSELNGGDLRALPFPYGDVGIKGDEDADAVDDGELLPLLTLLTLLTLLLLLLLLLFI
jgi:hypothetical protein